MTKPLFLIGITLLTWPSIAAAQNDSTFVADARKNAIQLYTQSIGVQSHLFNGSEYREYVPQGDEFPYLYDDVMTGGIKYNGQVYENIPLQYDLEKDQVITSYPYGSTVQLIRSNVEYFDIEGHRFVRLDYDKVAEGFYDLLYDGKMKFYARREKQRVSRIYGNQAETYFDELVKHLILKDGVFYPVRGKRSVMALMKDRKKELKRALREKKMLFGENREKSVTLLLTRYEQITKSPNQ